MNQQELAIGTARAGDGPAIAKLLIDCGLPADDISDHIEELVTAYCDNQLVATVGLESYGEVGLLRSLAVTPCWRRRGIAAELCRQIEAHARQSGVRRLYLLTTTAEEFFAHRGWCRVDRYQAPEAIRATSEFSSLCPASATFMARRFDGDQLSQEGN